MLTSKRQEWILQMIKGPDISPVSNCPGHYTSKSTISITANEQSITIRPTDVLDLSNPEFLVVHANGGKCTVPWDGISNLDFEEQTVAAAGQRTRSRSAVQRMLPVQLGKKVV
jgi:hypothetical protein